MWPVVISTLCRTRTNWVVTCASIAHAKFSAILRSRGPNRSPRDLIEILQCRSAPSCCTYIRHPSGPNLQTATVRRPQHIPSHSCDRPFLSIRASASLTPATPRFFALEQRRFGMAREYQSLIDVRARDRIRIIAFEARPARQPYCCANETALWIAERDAWLACRRAASARETCAGHAAYRVPRQSQLGGDSGSSLAVGLIPNTRPARRRSSSTYSGTARRRTAC